MAAIVIHVVQKNDSYVSNTRDYVKILTLIQIPTQHFLLNVPLKEAKFYNIFRTKLGIHLES